MGGWAYGILMARQQPEIAMGVMFVSLEDETGSVQVVVWPKLKARLRRPLLRSKAMAVKGTLAARRRRTQLDRWAC